MNAPGRRLVVQAEEVAAESTVVGLRDAEHRVDRDGSIGDGAAGLEHFDPGQRGERMARRHHPVARHRSLSSGVPDLWQTLNSEGGSAPLPVLTGHALTLPVSGGYCRRLHSREFTRNMGSGLTLLTPSVSPVLVGDFP